MVAPREYRLDNTVLTCLGHPSHPVEPGDMLCRICGSLVRGAMLGAYQVLELLGRGRHGQAYKAMYVRRQQIVTLKLSPLDAASVSFWVMAQQETDKVMQLHHPHILPVLNTSLWRPRANLLPSPSQILSPETQIREMSGRDNFILTLCQYAPLSLPQFLETMHNNRIGQQALSYLRLFIEQVGRVLGAIHRQGIVHGALVPGNFLLANQQHLWVADFGLARLHPPPPPYLAPELLPFIRDVAPQHKAWVQWEAVTPASDQYSFAVLCWQWLSSFLQLDRAVMEVLQRATQPDPRARFANIDVFVSSLLTRLQPSTYSSSMSSIQGRGNVPPQLPQSGTTGGSRAVTPPAAQPTSSGSSPPKPTPWMRRGDTYFAAHEYEKAIQAYQQALGENAQNATVWLALGDAHFALEQFIESLQAYDSAIRLNANDATAWFNRGTALEALGRRAEAESCYARSQLLREEL